MTKRYSTKRSLVASLLILCLCFTSFVGTTFAWFTDSVTSANNIIKSGNLDIEAEYTLDGETWNDFDGADDLFQKGAWEPGHTEVVAIRITNAGSLELKYKVNMNIVEEIVGKSVLGNDIVLSELLKVSTLTQQTGAVGDIAIALAFDGENRVGYENTASFKASNVLKAEYGLAPGDAHYLIVKVDMPETIGNEANHDGKNKPSIEFGIDILATQRASESDSFGNDYDENAQYPGEVSSVEDLKKVLAEGGRAALQNDITADGAASLVIPDGVEVNLDLNGYTLTNAVVGAPALINNGVLTINGDGAIVNGTNSTSKSHTVRNYGMLTINGGSIGTDDTAGAAVINDGDAVINGGIFASKQENVKSDGLCAYVFINNGAGTMTINDATHNGQTHGLFGAYNGKLIVKGGNYTMDGNGGLGCYVVYAASNAEVILLGGTVNTNNPRNGNVFYVYNNGNKFNANAVATDNITYVSTDIYLNGTLQSYDEENVASSAAELQTALDSAADGDIIYLAGDIAGDVVVNQKPDVKLVIDGNGNTISKPLIIDGKSATYTTAGITIKNVKFVADSITKDACINLGDGTNDTRYTCNVTIENCTFDVVGAVGVKSYTGGDKNLTIIGCTATERAHSLVQAKGVDGILVKDCEVYSKNGLNFNNSDNVVVDNCTVDVKGYAVRFGESSGGVGAAETYLIKNSSLKSLCDDGDAVIILRGTADYSTLTIENTTIDGSIEITNNATGATVVK